MSGHNWRAPAQLAGADSLGSRVTGVGIEPTTCGLKVRSGLIDTLAEMYLNGVIDQKGKIREEIGSKRIRRGESGLEYVLAWRVESAINKEIVIT